MGHDGNVQPRRQRVNVYPIVGGALFDWYCYRFIQFTVGSVFGGNCASNIAWTVLRHHICYHCIGCLSYLCSRLLHTGKIVFCVFFCFVIWIWICVDLIISPSLSLLFILINADKLAYGEWNKLCHIIGIVNFIDPNPGNPHMVGIQRTNGQGGKIIENFQRIAQQRYQTKSNVYILLR